MTVQEKDYKFLEVTSDDLEVLGDNFTWLVSQDKIDEYRECLYHGIQISTTKLTHRYLCGDVGCPNGILIEEHYKGEWL